MKPSRVNVYIYTRVSTLMQVDGYSLDAQKTRMKAFANYNNFNIVANYEDAGVSGKSIENRKQFNQMLDDIKAGKDNVSYVLVYKLSRFARNAADVLHCLQMMQDYGVNLICVEDGIDSSKDSGKLMISVLSAVAEIERENINVQTMAGRLQKAKEGKWNGGPAPYGYKLVNGKLVINEEEAYAIRTIFEQYAKQHNYSWSLANYLEMHNIKKIPRSTLSSSQFSSSSILRIIKNPVYCGKIAYGRSKTVKVLGTRNEYKRRKNEDYLLVQGEHQAIISEELWLAAQAKLEEQSEKYKQYNRNKKAHVHLLSNIVKCPVCKKGLLGNKNIKRKKDGSFYKATYYYGCKHKKQANKMCNFRHQIRADLLEKAVEELIIKFVTNEHFIKELKERINLRIDFNNITDEIKTFKERLRKRTLVKQKLLEDIDDLDPEAKHYAIKKHDLELRLENIYDELAEITQSLSSLSSQEEAVQKEKLNFQSVYNILIKFNELYNVMSDIERKQLVALLISKIEVYPERQANGQWLKSITFKFPIPGLDKATNVESVVLMSRV